MNKENLNILIAQLESEKGAKRGIGFNMATFLHGTQVDKYDSAGDMDKFTKHNPCGTVACIAGHAAILAKPNLTIRHLGMTEKGDGITAIARAWLGLDYSEARRLFVPGNVDTWLGVVTLAQALKVLYKLRDTGEVDWTIIN